MRRSFSWPGRGGTSGLSRLSLSQHDLWTYGRHDEEWTRLLKDGPGADARLFVDYFLVRLPAKEVVRRFAHEGLRLSAPRAFVSVRAPAHPSSADDVATREFTNRVCRLIVEYGRPLTRAASPRVRDGGTRPRAMHFFPAHFCCCHALAFPRSWSLSRARSPVSRRARRVVTTTPSAPLICCECAAARTYPIMRVHWSRRIARTFREWWHAASGRATITLAEHGEMLPLRVR